MDSLSLQMQRVADVSWVAFDTEATGYSNVTDRLVEVAGVKFRRFDGRWVGEGAFSELVRPGVAMTPEVMAIHGLTNADVAHAERPAAVLARFFQFAKGSMLLAHYAPFDVGAITFTCLREHLVVPGLSALDTDRFARKILPGLKDYSLETATASLGVAQETHHRALPDSRATMSLFTKCVEKLGNPDTLILGILFEQTGKPHEFEKFAELGRNMPDIWKDLQSAIEAGQDLRFVYRGGSQGNTPRRVTPSHLFARDGRIFLDGVCHSNGAMKGFRLDKIEELQTVARSAPPSGTTS